MSVTPVPPEWYRDGPPRNLDELVRDHLAREFDPLGSFEAAELVLELIAEASAKIDAMPNVVAAAILDGQGREVFMAALDAVLFTRAGDAPPQPRHPRPAAAPALPCSRPSCVRSQGHDGFHKDRDNEPLCGVIGDFMPCVRPMGHPNGHEFAAWRP